MRFSHMIPVPETEVEWYDIEKEKDEKYKDLVQNEIIYIRKNQEKIRKSAELTLLNEEATQSQMETLKKSKLKPYTDEQRKATDKAIEQIFTERFKNS